MSRDSAKLWYLDNFSLFKGLSRPEMRIVCDLTIMEDITLTRDDLSNTSAAGL